MPQQGESELSRFEHARRLGRYLICRKLADGGMGEVYVARTEGPGGFEKLVAVKVMHPELARSRDKVEMFLDEARIGGRIAHPNVCSVIDFGETEGVHFLVMEYLTGQPVSGLFERLASEPAQREDPLHFPRMARIVADALEGLHAAHTTTDEQGQPLNIIHRDVSPDNIFVTFQGDVRIMDFGIARAAQRVHETVAGTFKGRLAYASPEAFSLREVDHRTDIWSTGAVLWELLTNRHLFGGDNQIDILSAIMRDPIPAPADVASDVPAELNAITVRALQREPERRFETAREMARALNRFASQSGEHIGTGELAEWLERLFPQERSDAFQIMDAVREMESKSGLRFATSSAVEADTAPSPPPNVEGTAEQQAQALTGFEPTERGHAATEHSRGFAPTVQADGPAAETTPGDFRPGAAGGVTTRTKALVAAAVLVGVALVATTSYIVAARLLEGAGPEVAAAGDGPESSEGTGGLDELGAAPAPDAGQAAEGAPVDGAPGDRDAGRDEVAERGTATPVDTSAVDAGVAEASTDAGRGASAAAGEQPAAPQRRRRPPEPGVVSVYVRGGWAQVHVGGRSVGPTPRELTLPAGRHVLVLRPPEGPPIRRRVRVFPGKKQTLTVDLGSDR